ncbi:MAG: hypothetical protein BMS9Abin04_311 [Planctomycetia bacterium]|nr:MAG: hypothetical protein BMS9Abin04_311 [Planctomycetia bacterium]
MASQIMRLPVMIGGLFLAAAGCTSFVSPGQSPAVPVLLENPALMPVRDHALVWEQLVDVVDDYFRIQNQQSVQLVGNVLTEGRIDTFPRGGATYLEPQRRDSVGPYNRLESTLQTIRRQAHIRVIPEEHGFLVEVVVFKELEDLERPEHATTGTATFPTNTVSKGRVAKQDDHSLAIARPWISLGRDVALEQRILAQLGTRLGIGPPGVAYY